MNHDYRRSRPGGLSSANGGRSYDRDDIGLGVGMGVSTRSLPCIGLTVNEGSSTAGSTNNLVPTTDVRRTTSMAPSTSLLSRQQQQQTNQYLSPSYGSSTRNKRPLSIRSQSLYGDTTKLLSQLEDCEIDDTAGIMNMNNDPFMMMADHDGQNKGTTSKNIADNSGTRTNARSPAPLPTFGTRNQVEQESSSNFNNSTSSINSKNNNITSILRDNKRIVLGNNGRNSTYSSLSNSSSSLQSPVNQQQQFEGQQQQLDYIGESSLNGSNRRIRFSSEEPPPASSPYNPNGHRQQTFELDDGDKDNGEVYDSRPSHRDHHHAAPAVASMYPDQIHLEHDRDDPQPDDDRKFSATTTPRNFKTDDYRYGDSINVAGGRFGSNTDTLTGTSRQQQQQQHPILPSSAFRLDRDASSPLLDHNDGRIHNSNNNSHPTREEEMLKMQHNSGRSLLSAGVDTDIGQNERVPYNQSRSNVISTTAAASATSTNEELQHSASSFPRHDMHTKSREEDDMALARALQEEEDNRAAAGSTAVSNVGNLTVGGDELQMLSDEDQRARLVQMLLDVATSQAEQQRKRRMEQEERRRKEQAEAKKVPPRIVEYVAPDSLEDDSPAFSLVPESLFYEESGSDDTKDVCAICYDPLSTGGTAVALNVCGHIFHLDCIDEWMEESSKHCPQCRLCVKDDSIGKSPSGTMSISFVSETGVAGMSKYGSKRLIKIQYVVPDGFQREYHSNPGERYRGCTKTAFLNDSPEGRQLLRRLEFAFSHGHTFCIAPDPSSSTEKDGVDWGTIPHTNTIYSDKDEKQDLYYVACHEALDRLDVPR